MSRASFTSPLRLTVLFIAILATNEQIGQCQRLTGVYVDNGMGQTVAHRVSSRREKRSIARDILDMLQLPAVPTRRANDSTLTSASRYIQDVYKYSLNAENEVHLGNKDILKDSDVVVSYAATANNRPEKEDVLLRFDLSATPTEVEAVLRAQLRLSMSARKSGSTVAAHAFMRSENETRKRRLRLIDSAEVSTEDWIELNVTEALRYWLSRGQRTASLRLSIAGNRTKPVLDDEPFLVGYFRSASRLQQATAATRWKRSSGDLRAYGKGAIRTRPSSSQCRLHTLYVRFRELEFDRLIVAPDGYDAQYCAGECRFPLSGHKNATNHAIVQTLVHFLQPGRVPQACCVPTQLDPLPVLYSRDGRNHVLKKYHNMVIRSCGCH